MASSDSAALAETDPLAGRAFTELWDHPDDDVDANPPPDDRDWEWHEVSRQRLHVARRWTPYFLAGAVANSLLCIAVLWPTFQFETLVLWALLHAAAAALMALSLLRAKAPDRRTGSGLPLPTLFGAAVIGAFWGLPIWLDGTAIRNELAQWQTGAFLLLTTFLAVAFLEGARVIARNVLVPAWVLFGLGLALFGDPFLSIGACGLLVVVVLASHIRGKASDDALTTKTNLDYQARQVLWQADHDGLTGALSRQGLRHHLDKTNRESSHFVLLVSLDNFSSVNDKFGIAIGDTVLREVASRLSRLVDPGSCIARVSGDEFVVVVPGRSPDNATRLASEMIQRIEDKMYRGEDGVSVSATIGMTQALGRPLDLGRAMRESNTALRKAVRSQRGTPLLFTRDMGRQLEKRQGLESGLHRALVDGEIEIWGQPIVNLSEHRVSHVELVARWIRADGSRVPPSVFVPLAEEIGIIGDLTDHMVRGAGQALVEFRDHQWLRHAGVIVNVRAEEIQRPDMLPNIDAVVRDFEIAPGQLNIGLKGVTSIEQSAARSLFEELSKRGVGFGTDDLSDGAAWLEDVEDLQAGVLRLDKALVKGARDSTSQRDFLRAFTQMGTTWGFTVVAEGIEDAATAQFVRDQGVEYAQGFLFARAMPLSRLTGEETAVHLTTTLHELGRPEPLFAPGIPDDIKIVPRG